MSPTFIDPIGLGLAATAYAAFAALALTRHANRLAARAFIALLGVQAVWALAAWSAQSGVALAMLALPVVEAVRPLAWIAFLLALGRRDAPVGARAMPILVVAALLAIAPIAADALGGGTLVRYAPRVLTVALLLLVLEQLYRSADATRRGSLRHLAIAVVCVAGFDLLLFTEALIGQAEETGHGAARGYVNALAAPLLAVAAARNPAWQLDIAISRRIVFHSATLLAAVAYVAVVALAAYQVARFGNGWGQTAQTVLLVTATIGLLVAILSESVRATIRVFVSKHFFDYRYDYREEWLRLTRLLSETGDAPGRSLAERGIEGIGSLVEATGGSLWIRDGDRYELAGHVGRRAEPASVPADRPLLDWLATRRWIVDLDEWRERPDRYPELRVDAPFDDRHAWLIVPMIVQDELAGLIVLDAPRTRVELDWEVRDVLRVAAAQVASFLGVQRATEKLAQAEQFESFNRMSTFIVHDLKNLVAQLSLLSRNARRHRADPAFVDDMLGTVDVVSRRMQAILDGLRRPLPSTGAPRRVAIGPVLSHAVAARNGDPPPELLADDETLAAAVRADPERLSRVIGHLVQNGIEACTSLPAARVTVRARQLDGSVRIEVEDTGHGMDAGFVRHRLFRPFVSTKPQGMGVGLFECREYVREIGGTLAVDSVPGRGTRFTIMLPLADMPLLDALHG